jgi:chorismate mutase
LAQVIAAGSVIGLLAGCSESVPTGQTNSSGKSSLDRLVEAGSQRLQTADPIAAFKWINHGNVEDAARAEQVVSSVGELATAHSIDPEFVKKAFRYQISATEAVEYELFAQWKLGERPLPQTAPDLTTSRATIDMLNKRMVDEMATQWRVLHSPSCKSELDNAVENAATANKLDEFHRTALTAATRSYCS